LSRPITQVSGSVDNKKLNNSKDKSTKQDNESVTKKKGAESSHKATIETNAEAR